MSVISMIRPTTELEAINIMLGSIGESPLPSDADLSDLADADLNVEAAVGILRETTREVLTAGWRFNTLTGFELEPVDTYDWSDTSGATTTLNIFKLPDDILAWVSTKCPEMLGVDLIERRALKYTEGGEKPKVLFDRIRNRDGVDASRYPVIYLDSVFSCDFEDMPEPARRYSTIVASRRLAQRVPVNQLQVMFSEGDEMAALRVLKRTEGITKPLNIFKTVDAYELAGRRPLGGGGYYTRVYPGGVS